MNSSKPLFAIVSMFALPPSTSTSASPERFYSGAEWVLDSEGEVLASSAILLDRNPDLHHAQIENNIQRALPDRRERALTDEQLAALLPHTSTQKVSVIGASTAPTHTLEGRSTRSGRLSSFAEQLRGAMLLSREVIRDENGVVEVHVILATPLSEHEYTARAAETQ